MENRKKQKTILQRLNIKLRAAFEPKPAVTGERVRLQRIQTRVFPIPQGGVLSSV